MNKKLEMELIEETTIDDIPEKYRPMVEIVGIKPFIDLCKYFMGDRPYFPKSESVIAPARNRRMRKEFNGYNQMELAKKYGLSIKHVSSILKDVPMPNQMHLFDYIED